MTASQTEHLDLLGRLSLMHNKWTAAVGIISGEHGISAAQFGVLRVLESSWPQPMTCSSIGCNLLERTPDVTRLLDRLDKAALVLRERSEEDRRVVKVHLTEEGLHLTRRMIESVSRYEDGLLSDLSEAEQELLSGLLNRIKM